MARQSQDLHRQKVRDLLRSIREDAGLRQIDVADQLHEPQSFVSKYESGERSLDVVELGQVCEALGVTLLEFVQRLGHK